MQTVGGVPTKAPTTDEVLKDQEQTPARLKYARELAGGHPSRFSLRISANWWRALQTTGASLHFIAPPRPPNPNYVKKIPSTLSSTKGQIPLYFYLPKKYHDPDNKDVRYPAIINFHGGGYTIGTAADDARFARIVAARWVFISVDYRLAPEHPFPTAVDDGADAVLYVIRNAAELRIDPSKLVTAGFSSGGNLAFTVPIRLHRAVQAAKNPNAVPDHRILAAVAWYPDVDYTISRAEKRATAAQPDKTLPSMFTDLFDAAYLWPPSLDLANPELSPAQGSDELLREAVPPHVSVYTCEWDMLRREAEHFAARLGGAAVGKDVKQTTIEGVAHAWDKSPYPFRPPERSEELYRDCCGWLQGVFDGVAEDTG